MFRAACVLGFLVLALSTTGSAAPLQASPPQITLLTPGNGTTVVNSPELGTAATFGWRIDWRGAPTEGSVAVVIRIATDPALAQNAAENTFTCPARNANCRTIFRPNRVYSGTYYWRVSMSGVGRATSPTWSFTGVRPAGTGGRDTTKPRVRALTGLAQRGQTAFFKARVGDDRGTARVRAALMRRGHEVARAAVAFRPVSWGRTQTLYSNRPLSRGLAAGRYRLCVTAWDRAGNKATGCALYRVR